MKPAVWIAADSIVSPLGTGSALNYARLRSGESALRRIDSGEMSEQPFVAAAFTALDVRPGLTRFEELCMRAIEDLLSQVEIDPGKTLLLLSSTKGNIRLLDAAPAEQVRIDLHASAAHLAESGGFAKSLVVSNACISGLMALIVGKRLLEAEQWEQVLVLGADELSRFVVSGFQSLQAMSDEACKPFDAARKGINLGEAAAAILLSTKPGRIRLAGGGLSNDAHHISAPSRDGLQLAAAISGALREAGMQDEQPDFISAHGTATLYNDEMEAKAFASLGLAALAIHSLKACFGHSLGAAGVVEAIICAHALAADELIPSPGFEHLGVSEPLHIQQRLESQALKTCLKTASGFGGCNAALVLSKNDQTTHQ